MHNKTLTVLEYNKILEQLAAHAASTTTKEYIQKLTPSIDFGEIKKWQQETDEAVTMILRKGNAPIGALYHIDNILRRVKIGAILSPKELLQVANVLSISKRVKKYAKENRKPLADGTQEHYTCLDPIFEDIQILNALVQSIKDCIISEQEIADHASSELSSIRRQIKSATNKVKDLLAQMIQSPKYQKYLQEPIVTMRGDRHVVPVKSEYKGMVSGIVHDSSASGATLFVEPMAVVEANNQLRQLRSKEEQEIERILAALTVDVSEHLQTISSNAKIIIELDFIFAKAKLSIAMHAVQPEINDVGYINIKRARHPLLDQKTVVATDIYLGKNFDTLVITGPNTGGKTVTLKTIGLFTLMAQAGLQIPADYGSEMAVFDKVFADIGDEQSIEQSLSTFSSHMTNIVNILNEVDQRSLVLFDELGAGTDPVEGAALAMAILEHLHQLGARTAATTHYSELKLFALSTTGIQNAACEFDVETLKPTYKLLIGVPGKSNAFAISKRLNLQQPIIDRAKTLITQEDMRFEDVISELEKNRYISEQEKQKAIRYKKEASALKETLEEQKHKFHEQKEKMHQEAALQERKIIQQAKEEAEEIIASLKKMQEQQADAIANKEIEDARNKLRQKEDTLDEKLSKTVMPQKRYAKLPKNLKPGDRVEITTLNQKGTVISAPDANEEVMIQVGIMKINVHLSNLRKVSEENKVTNKSGGMGKLGVAKASNISTEVDVRGQMLEDALMHVDKFLDDAMLGGLKQITIIHGKGTGVLRKGIHNILKSHKHVKKFRLGKYGEGESGVTVVELKGE